MKNFNELTPEDCQSFLYELFEDEQVLFKRIIEEKTEDPGIEYETHDSMDTISVSNPDLLCWMYKNNVDLTMPLNNLKYEYNEMDEMNSVLFEYVMEINKILNRIYARNKFYLKDFKNEQNQKIWHIYSKDFEDMMIIQKELINKI
jgi:hypothetical protein